MGPVEAIFESKKNLYNSYNAGVAEHASGAKIFDLHRAHFLYGKVDRHGDAVILDTQGNLTSSPAGKNKTEWIIDFVKDAFMDFRGSYRSKIFSGDLDNSTVYGKQLFTKKAYRKGDLFHSYFNYYMNKLYSTFVNDYISKDRRYEKITNFKTFVEQFMVYMSQVAYYFPLTLTGFILSIHCSPYVSGLMLDLSNERHGTQDNFNVITYASDPVWRFIINESRKYGFMVDRNAPWRLVFNIASGHNTKDEDQPRGAARYMRSYGQNLDTLFSSYYGKAHLGELKNIQNVMRELYQTYYAQFSTYYKIEYFMPKISDIDPWLPGASGCHSLKTKVVRNNREPYPLILGSTEEVAEYYIKIVLKLRMWEAGMTHRHEEYVTRLRNTIEQYRLYGEHAALNYINNFTKGIRDSKFIRRGKNWYGQSHSQYVERLRLASEKLDNADQVNYELTGTGNIERG